MEKFIGVDWAGKRWVVVIEDSDGISVGTAPSLYNIWTTHGSGDTQMLIDIPIGLPESADESPRPCDTAAREKLPGLQAGSVFDVPCRQAVHSEPYAEANKINESVLGASIRPQSWGIAERVREADTFMREVCPESRVRESHPEVCFAQLTDTDQLPSKKTEDGLEARAAELPTEYEAEFNAVSKRIESTTPWKRRLGIRMRDDILDAMVLAFVSRLESRGRVRILGGETDAQGLRMEIALPSV